MTVYLVISLPKTPNVPVFIYIQLMANSKNNRAIKASMQAVRPTSIYADHAADVYTVFVHETNGMSYHQ
jgi:multisubunit Na+/H+ antiporter MnhE subunit